MAEDHRIVDDERTNPTVGIIVNVRAADTDRVQLDANIARAQDLFVLLDRKIAKGEFVLAFQNQ